MSHSGLYLAALVNSAVCGILVEGHSYGGAVFVGLGVLVCVARGVMLEGRWR